jgi:hypothetical protein
MAERQDISKRVDTRTHSKVLALECIEYVILTVLSLPEHLVHCVVYVHAI